MRLALLASTAAFALAVPAYAQTDQRAAEATGQDSPQQTQAEAAAATLDTGEIVVTARKREETLLDVPIAATAITGTVLENRGINSVREAASLTPGLNINSDGTGRAFVAIRGVGVTLVQTVQPGVGLFIDGVYQPNTSYLNNPLLDVERIEVLRGPQGTLYGKNTLGGAINVITRQPGNDLEVRLIGSYAGPDDSWLVSGSVGGPIVKDVLAVRVAASHRQQDGFLRNTVIGGNANPFNSDSVNATIRFTPGETTRLTIKGAYDWVKGVNTPYARVAGPTDYSRNVQFNTPNTVRFRYKDANARLEQDLGDHTLTLVGAYNERTSETADGEGDFGPINFVRSTGGDTLRTRTAEARLDSKWTDTISSLFGLFYSNETFDAASTTTIVPLARSVPQTSATEADTYAAFGTIFWKPNSDYEVALGLRYDHEDRSAKGTVGGAPVPEAKLKSNQWEPRITVTRHWDREFMTYASVSRGYRGGGFNAPTAPVRTYKGDSAWAYEVGAKFASADRRFSLSTALFYNDYKNYIGLNSVAPSSAGGLVTVDLNAGDVESYGIEIEGFVKPVQNWTISGGLTVMHARLTDTSPYTAITGRLLSSDRLTFQPDVFGNINSDYTIPLGDKRSLTFNVGATGKGKRLAATLNENTPTLLKGYVLANSSIVYRTGPLELSAFVNNIFKKKYFESYIEKTTLQLAGINFPGAPATDLGIIGDLRRYGVRAALRF
ncbi:TonB-dependent receptor [Sphingomonas jatrophae]|uniref:Iron complex outermembrane recepter protein n=1 Tax=Sphingomonas jatrophae TaxID=1166337 RepID=A0A1I6M2J9_9SPHN|nr:TonB-dependent receptor [Sphingomonas jatrophae]SFS09911.1 iron complex outermembrane recepter protein [Sphingomonas jatrophae]